MRILHLGRNSANQGGYLVRALRELGHEAEMWEIGADPFGYKPDRSIDTSSGDPRIFWDLFEDALPRFDVFHFHAARTLFPTEWGGLPAFWDLPILRVLGKKVFHTWHGADVTIRRVNDEINPWSYFKHSDLESDDDRVEKQIQVMRTYCNATFVVSYVYLHFVPEARWSGRTLDLRDWPEREPSSREIPRVLHVPSRRGKKGSEYIEAGMRALEGSGVKFEFRLLEGVSHAEAKAAIADADIVIDNVLTGDYEVVSLETMASNRVACSFMLPEIAERFPDVPVYNLDPDSFVERMRALIADRELRLDLASRGRAYVAREHDAPIVARRLLDGYESPDEPVQLRTYPDWASLQHARRLERTEYRVFQLEQQIARMKRTGAARAPSERVPAGARRGWRRLRTVLARRLPPPVKMRLARARDSILRARRNARR
jgi:glycosyltransferase involved in cell wall biosynthesis